MNKKKVAIAAAAAVALGTVLQYACRRHAESVALATLYGNVDIRDVSLAFRTGGRVAQLLVDEGDTVKEGDLVATLDPEPLQDAVASARATMEALEARNALMHRGYRSEDVGQARARLEAARAALAEAQEQFRRASALVPEGAAPGKALDAGRSARDQAAANVRSAEENLRQMTTGYRPEEIRESDGQLAQARAALETANLALRDARLQAPSDGVILTRAVEKGAMVQAGTPAFSLSLTRPVWVRAYVNETQLGFFSGGTRVTLATDLRPDHLYHGRVGFVSPTAEFTPKTVETPDLRTSLTYRLRVVVEDPDAALLQGMPVTVRLAR
jgi:HlyD family secretion protein